ncbi:MAG TPA: tRNA-specific adenosine deaminase [Ruminococcaceae bacterium]|nr:tRNA-specific adenosine deaminase [Oscillospiraceae bacterium]
MDSRFMADALFFAKEAYREGEIPVGAVIVKDGAVVSSGRNRREKHQNALAHAEIEAIDSACKKLGTWRLDGCALYVTLEPCPMCMGAILNARIPVLVFGAYDLEQGCADSAVRLSDFVNLSKPEVYGGICEDECKALLKDFFATVRKQN